MSLQAVVMADENQDLSISDQDEGGEVGGFESIFRGNSGDHRLKPPTNNQLELLITPTYT